MREDHLLRVLQAIRLLTRDAQLRRALVNAGAMQVRPVAWAWWVQRVGVSRDRQDGVYGICQDEKGEPASHLNVKMRTSITGEL